MWSLSSIPTEAAWAVLKREDYDLTRVMDPEDVKAAAKHYETISPEKQQIMQQVEEAFRKMPDKLRLQLMASAHRLIDEHRGNLGNVLEQAPGEMPESTEPGTFKLTKFFPLVIGVVFALDAINASQGAKASLVGNVATDIGNGISGKVGGDPKIFGETNYGDVLERDDTAEYTNPFTGEPIPGTDVIENPSIWEKVSRGAVSGALSFINPFAALGGAGRVAGKYSGKVGTKANVGVGIGQQKLGQKIMDRGYRSGADKIVGGKGPMPRRMAGAYGDFVHSSGSKRITDATKGAAAKAKDWQKAANKTGGTGAYGKTSRLAGRGSPVSTTALRMSQAALRSPGIRDKIKDAAGAFIPSGSSPNIHGTASASPSAGGGGTGMTGVGNRASMGQGDKQIWSGAMEQQQGGAYGTKKGEYMTIGDEILKETKDRMQYAVCPACGKANCNCKEYKNKADDKKKKPAHGVLVIIGTNAGPGPIKEGKRVKKD